MHQMEYGRLLLTDADKPNLACPKNASAGRLCNPLILFNISLTIIDLLSENL